MPCVIFHVIRAVQYSLETLSFCLVIDFAKPSLALDASAF